MNGFSHDNFQLLSPKIFSLECDYMFYTVHTMWASHLFLDLASGRKCILAYHSIYWAGHFAATSHIALLRTASPSFNKAMFKVFMICLLVAYYFYFYFDFSKPVPEPTTAPLNPPPHHYRFSSKNLHHFQFHANQVLVWEHTLPDTYMYYNHKIIPRDVCYGQPDSTLVAAKGKMLYEYMKKQSPTQRNGTHFQRNDEQAVQQGSVFFFQCQSQRIQKVDACPSGTLFVRDRCQDINVCTGQPNDATFPHPNANQYIQCQDGKGIVYTCPRDTFFRQNMCLELRRPAYFCQFFPTEHLLLDGGKTRMHCEKGKPVFKTCKPGTLFFDRDVCEPVVCQNKPDGTRIPLPEANIGPFKFIPGYRVCQNGKIGPTFECEKKFHEELDEFFLPKVFDTTRQACVPPSFGENVFSDDPETILPVRDFTRHLKNWSMSSTYDRLQGHMIQNSKRKLVTLDDGLLVSKRFKRESACLKGTERVPILHKVTQYYNCPTQTTLQCPPDHFFNGKDCVPLPPHSVDFKGIPIFQFDPLNHENWIKPFDYAPANIAKPVCTGDTLFSGLYNMCVHPECEPYTFLRLIPDLGILLPSIQKAKCVYDEQTQTLNKKDFPFQYSYWDQNVSDGPEAECVPGMNVKTGNFIWDKTLYATCQPNQPFVFCPVPKGIEQVAPHVYACTPPPDNMYLFNEKGPTYFTLNEIQRILPGNPTKKMYIQRRMNAPREEVTLNGLEIAKNEKLNMTLHSDEKLDLPLQTDDQVILVLKQRVTHPPNVGYMYDEQNIRTTRVGPSNQGYILKGAGFTTKPLTFPRYNPQLFVDNVGLQHLV